MKLNKLLLEPYLKPCLTSLIERFVKMLTIFAKKLQQRCMPGL